MNLNQIDLNLLRVFDAIYTQGSLTRAAEALGITQPAVSHSLARMRRIYGDPLFTRSPVGVNATPVADSIASDISEALKHVRISVSRATGFQPETSVRHFRLALDDLTESVLIPPLLNRLEKIAPNISLEVFEDPDVEIVKQLTAGDLDFVAADLLTADAEIMHSPVIDEEYVCAVRKDHPVITKSLSLEQFLSLRHIEAVGRKGGLGVVDSALRGLSHERLIVLKTQHHLQAAHVVAQTDLALTTTRSIAALHDLKTLKLPFDVQHLAMCLYWHTSSETDPGALWIRKQILEIGAETRAASTIKINRAVRRRSPAVRKRTRSA